MAIFSVRVSECLLLGCQAEPGFAARRRAVSLPPPIQSGGWGRWTGFGSQSTLSVDCGTAETSRSVRGPEDAHRLDVLVQQGSAFVEGYTEGFELLGEPPGW